MIGSLEDWRWAVSDGAAELRALVTPDAPVGTLARLRERWPAERVSVVAELLGGRAKAASKFPDRAPGLACDREGVEMASSALAAAYKAARFAEALGPGARVTDACCGIGGDSMALADAGLGVTAVDLDERRAWMAGHNARCDSVCADVREPGRALGALHIDPSRRGGGRRTRDADAFEPPLDDLAALLGRAGVAAVKLNPGTDGAGLPGGELEIISESGRLTQGVLWTGLGDAHARRATMIDRDGTVRTMAGEPDRPYDAADIGAWVHTFDPAVERADLVHLLIAETGLSLVHPGTGLLTGAARCGSGWVRPFRVVEDMAWNLKGVRARLRELGAGIVTVKTRAAVVDPDRLSRDLRGKGGRDLVLFVLKVGEKPRAIITELADEIAPPAGACPAGGADLGDGA